mmetsp:Transcript_4160/g.8847  ORF Transcript_4160/g.8847 Transcript_4160/m.8847 type:complete len:129 (-) Transcript_4160:944-1330(-)
MSQGHSIEKVTYIVAIALRRRLQTIDTGDKEHIIVIINPIRHCHPNTKIRVVCRASRHLCYNYTTSFFMLFPIFFNILLPLLFLGFWIPYKVETLLCWELLRSSSAKPTVRFLTSPITSSASSRSSSS